MAEVFEDDGNAVEAFAASIDSRKNTIEFVGDAFLFVERRKRCFKSTNIFRSNSWIQSALYKIAHCFHEIGSSHQVKNPSWINF